MKKVKLKDKTFELFIPSSDIQNAITLIAQRINSDFKDQCPVFLVILNGSFMFSSDLLKQIDLDCEVSFVKLSSYSGTHTTQQVKKLIGLNEQIKNRPVIILEDIIDTGITMENMLSELNAYKPSAVAVATLLLKPDALIKKINIDYTGIRIPNDFIVGFGLDYNGLGRNLQDIYKIVS